MTPISNERIDRIASIAGIVPAVAVVIPLVYLAYEPRQNTPAVKSSACQSIHHAEDLFWQSISDNRKASARWLQALEGGLTVLAEDDQAQFVITARRLTYLFQNVHYQRRKGVVDDELWGARLASLDEFLALDGFREVLTASRPHLSEPFIDLVDTRLMALQIMPAPPESKRRGSGIPEAV